MIFLICCLGIKIEFVVIQDFNVFVFLMFFIFKHLWTLLEFINKSYYTNEELQQQDPIKVKLYLKLQLKDKLMRWLMTGCKQEAGLSKHGAASGHMRSTQIRLFLLQIPRLWLAGSDVTDRMFSNLWRAEDMTRLTQSEPVSTGSDSGFTGFIIFRYHYSQVNSCLA